MNTSVSSCRSWVTYLLFSAFVCVSLTGCGTIEFAPETDIDVELFPEIRRWVAAEEILPWYEEPPSEIRPDVVLFYVLQVETAARSEQYLLRLVATSELVESTGTQRRRRMNIDRDVAEKAMARGLTSEFSGHSDLWVEERTAGTLLDGWLRGDLPSTPQYKVMVDTWGPIQFDQDSVLPEWERAEAVRVMPELFGADFVHASLDAQQLLVTPLESVSAEERHRVLQQTCRAKFKLVFALLTTMRSPALRSIMKEILESPGAGAMTLVAGNYLLRSKEGFLQWFFSSFGIRLDQSHLDTNLADSAPKRSRAGTSIPGSRPEPLRFRFDPSISTTQIMMGEAAVVNNSQAPLLSAGLVALEGSNPYDEQVRFKLALLGWKRDQPPGRLLSDIGQRWRFAPDSASFSRNAGSEVWLIGSARDGWVTKVEGGPWIAGDWIGTSGTNYAALREDKKTIDMLDLAARPLAVTTKVIAGVSGDVKALAVSADGSFVAIESESSAPTVRVYDLTQQREVGHYPESRIATVGFSGPRVLELESPSPASASSESATPDSGLDASAAQPQPVSPTRSRVDLEQSRPQPTVVRSMAPAETPSSVTFDWDEAQAETRLSYTVGDRQVEVRTPIRVESCTPSPDGRWWILQGWDPTRRVESSWLVDPAELRAE
ncbi:MAG: hypothetical protein AAF581_18520 [Planctomycetota bacterium]